MAVMNQFLDVSSVKRALNRTCETSVPLKCLAGFGEMPPSYFMRRLVPPSYFMRRLVQAPETRCCIEGDRNASLKVSSYVAIVSNSHSIVSVLIVIATFFFVHAVRLRKSR